MKLCRFNRDRLGLIEGDEILDVSAALKAVPLVGWPVPLGDPLIVNLGAIMQAIEPLRDSAERFALDAITLHSPLCNPSKVMAAPANYRLHVELDTKDAGVDQGVHRQALVGIERPAEHYGLFLKATSSIVGPAEGIEIALPERRTDYEVELAVVIGQPGRDIARADAMAHVAGYCLGLDITVRGAEDRSFRKSPDSYTVLGPYFVTADEVPDPHDLTLSLWLNGERRQHSSTAAMTVDIPDLIELASRFYTLQPGDVLLTGTPEGVGAIVPGDEIKATCDGMGIMLVRAR